MNSSGVGFLNQSTAAGVDAQGRKHKELREHLADPLKSPRAAYVGFDPTANSLTIGNLMGIMTLRRFQRPGISPSSSWAAAPASSATPPASPPSGNS
jgi:tyrosyl-tRNA synthetase